jgi:hypothetical protein
MNTSRLSSYDLQGESIRKLKAAKAKLDEANTK